MKIKAYQIKPGMLINTGDKDNKDWELVTEIKRKGKRMEYSHFDLHVACGGQMVGWLKRKQKVTVITEGREEALRSILKELHRNLHYIGRDVATVELIQAMDERTD